MPSSLAKDFYIWLFLQQQDTTEQEAKIAFDQVRNKNRANIQRAYLQKVDDIELAFQRQCRAMDALALTNASKECIKEGFTVLKAVQADDAQLRSLLNKITNAKDKRVIEAVLSQNSFEAIIDDPSTFYALYNSSGNAYRTKHLNHKASQSQIERLAANASFNTTILHTVLSANMDNMQRSLLFKFDSSALDATANFFLGINAMQHQKPELAMHYFAIAKEEFYYRFDKDRATFWLYLASEDESYLQELLSSRDLNIFTIYAKKHFDQPIDSYVHINSLGNKAVDYDHTSPIDWFNTLQKVRDADKDGLRNLANMFKSDHTVGEYTFIKSRYHGFSKHYFPTPFLSELAQAYSREDLALLYAIIRQESRFIPASISTSFALGKTQVMPFLVRAIAEERGEDIALTDMFEPKRSIEYGLHQIDFLKRSLYHPLLVAYGYNGGIGFTQRKILQQGLFENDGAYEPWLSMELVPYSESRHYGKVVLANYYVYLDILDKKEELDNLLNPLVDGTKIDRWRR